MIPDSDKLRMAARLLASGHTGAANRLYLAVCFGGRDNRARLDSAIVLVQHLSPADSFRSILRVSNVGIRCAENLKDAQSEAFLLGKKAECLALLASLEFVPVRRRLHMTPGWFGFSLERDESRFKELTNRIQGIGREVYRLFTRGLALAKPSTKAQMLISEARVHFNGYMDLKMEYVKPGILPGVVINLIRPYGLDYFLHFTSDERAKMNERLKQCEKSYLTSVEEFRKEGDELGAALAYYNLANSLRAAFHFRKAKEYLRRARDIAQHKKHDSLIRSIETLERKIRLRNRDIPNYVVGERRN